MGTRAYVTGVGELAPRRDTGTDTILGMMATVASEAVKDAGIEAGQVDGLLVAPLPPEVIAVTPSSVVEYLGLRVKRADIVDLGGATGAGMVLRASQLIEAGVCKAALCVLGGSRSATNPFGLYGGMREQSPTGDYEGPYGMTGANAGYAMIAMRHMYEYGTRPEDLAKIAVQQRFNATTNPLAIFREPITEADVLGSPMVVDPLHLLEIVMPCGGAAAVVVTDESLAKCAAHAPVAVLGGGEYCTHRSITYAPSLTDSAIAVAAAQAFAAAGKTPQQMDLLSLYDCYTITVLITLEDIGLCPKGHGGAFVREHDLRWCGDLPLNPHGGQLSFGQAGLAGGMSHVTEAVRQLSGRSLGSAVPKCSLAYVNGNGGIMSEQVGLVLGV